MKTRHLKVSKSRRPRIQKTEVKGKTKVFSGRVMQERLNELKELYPQTMTSTEIINDLIQEKLARAKFDQWMNHVSKDFKTEDFDLESIR